MRDVSLWRCLLGVENTVVEDVEFDEDAELLVAHWCTILLSVVLDGLLMHPWLLPVVHLADEGVTGFADDLDVRWPRPLVAGGALVGSLTGCSAW